MEELVVGVQGSVRRWREGKEKASGILRTPSVYVKGDTMITHFEIP